MGLCSADVEQGVANCDGLAGGTINLNNADILITSGRGNLSAVGSELSPVTSGDGGIIGNTDESGDGLSGVVVPHVGGGLFGTVHNDGALTGVGGCGDNDEVVDDTLAAMIVDSVCLLIEDEAVVDETTFDEPAGDSGRIVVDLILFELFRAGGSDAVGDKESCALREVRGRDLNDLAAVDFAEDAFDDHFLGTIGILDEGRILHHEVGKLIRAESNTALIGDVLVAHVLHACEEALICVALGDAVAGGVAVGNCGCSESSEYVGVELGHADFVDLTGEGFACIGNHLGLELVAFVYDKGEATVFSDGEGLNVTAQISGGAVTRRSRTSVVVHRNDGDGVDFNGLFSGELVIVVQGYHSLRLTIETLVNLTCVFTGEIHSACHVNHSFIMARG